MATHADGQRLRELAERCRVKLEYIVLPFCDRVPVVERGPPGVLFAHSTLRVESPWVLTLILDQSRLDKIVSVCCGEVWCVSWWLVVVCVRWFWYGVSARRSCGAGR